MHRLLSTMLAVSVILHAAIGCCAHHPHSCETECCDVPSASAGSCGCATPYRGASLFDEALPRGECAKQHGDHPCHGDGSSSDDEGDINVTQQAQHSESHGDHKCEGESCSFVGTEESPQLKLTNLHHFRCVLEVDPLSTQIVSNGTNLEKPKLLYAGHSSLRYHLSLGVLLI